ncbi:formylglycine-generating enzyme family protein [Rhodohalobacter sp. 8-1]|uniref:formylglycine-generating enzyme family protein n=1 Tax=Rhodohalobacter sp. 8-1 TaxID=3131972 RepID=UPI0030EF72A1
MKLSTLSYLLLPIVVLTVLITVSAGAQSKKVEIPAGYFHSVLPEVVGEPVRVESFFIDETAVTYEDYRNFLTDQPRWRSSDIPAIYAGKSYLKNWKNDLDYGDKKATQPVTSVSWYAANAYCGWKGGRLPTLNEWEYAAQAMEFESSDDADRFSSELIGWYSAVNANQVKPVGSSGIENKYGVKDMFGLIMEWVEDFKPPVADDLSLDCGTVGRMQGSSTLYGYAMSIRYITRMSFKPISATGMLGFRCAYDTVQNGNEPVNENQSTD